MAEDAGLGSQDIRLPEHSCTAHMAHCEAMQKKLQFVGGQSVESINPKGS